MLRLPPVPPNPFATAAAWVCVVLFGTLYNTDLDPADLGEW